MSILVNSDGDHPVQAFPLVEGRIDLTSLDNPILHVSVVQAVTDGIITLNFKSGGTKGVSLTEGQVFALVNVKSVTIISGTFRFA